MALIQNNYRVMLEMENGTTQFRVIRKGPESMPLIMQWPDGIKGEFIKISKKGYAYYKQYF